VGSIFSVSFISRRGPETAFRPRRGRATPSRPLTYKLIPQSGRPGVPRALRGDALREPDLIQVAIAAHKLHHHVESTVAGVDLQSRSRRCLC
jgi:hypothetical protein